MNKAIIEFESGNDPLFNRMKFLSEQRSHSHGNEDLIVTDNDKEEIARYFDEAVALMASDLGWTDRVKNLEGTLLYNYSQDEKDRNMNILIPIIKRCLLQHMMYQWATDHLQAELAGMEKQLYKEKISEILDASTNPGSLQRKYRAYF